MCFLHLWKSNAQNGRSDSTLNRGIYDDFTFCKQTGKKLFYYLFRTFSILTLFQGHQGGPPPQHFQGHPQQFQPQQGGRGQQLPPGVPPQQFGQGGVPPPGVHPAQHAQQQNFQPRQPVGIANAPPPPPPGS